MDPRTFDGMIRRLSGALSRRSLVGGSLGAAVLSAVGLSDDALAKKRGGDQVEAEDCIPTGKKCPQRQRPRRRGKRKQLTCEKNCCQGTFTTTIRKRGKKKGQPVNRCSCIPLGEDCKGDASNCCTGACADGVCQVQGCTSLTEACTTDAQCCSTVCNAAGFGPTGDTCTTCRTGGADCAAAPAENTCCEPRACTAADNTECCSVIGESCGDGDDCCDLATADCDNNICCVNQAGQAPGGCPAGVNAACCSGTCNIGTGLCDAP